MTDTHAKSRRRFLRFSLRAMLLVMLAVGVPLAWLSREIHRARAQQAAALTMRGLGYSVAHDKFDLFGQTTRERLVRPFVDGDLRNILQVGPLKSGSPAQLTDADLIHLGNFPQLDTLSLGPAPITDVGLVHLQSLTYLRGLRPDGTRIHGPGLVYCQGMTRLIFLSLSEMPVTDEGLALLYPLHQLERLRLENTRVTDASVAALQHALPNCQIAR